MSDSSISLNKFLSATGLCSRREADRWIEAGRVKINSQVAKRGNRVHEGDQVLLDNKPLQQKAELVYIALHKPPGITCTTDRQDPTNIIDFVQHPQRIFPIGRLDKPSTGLILLTNDGDIVNKILREENEHDKEYIVSVNRPISHEFIHKMQAGVPILDTITKPCKVEKIGKQVFRITLTQGLNRQIRRMCEALDYKVITLKRVRIMNIRLGKLPVGTWRALTKKELDQLQQML
jgi:23S rRNA pseudouridine2604 synthase